MCIYGIEKIHRDDTFGVECEHAGITEIVK